MAASLGGLMKWHLFFWVWVSLALGTERVLLVGGMEYPAAAMEEFAGWARDGRGSILVVSWGGMGHESATFRRFAKAVEPFFKGEIVKAPLLEEMPEKRELFLRQLENASAVFFTGGDQEVLMRCLRSSDLLSALRKRFQSGAAFGGASAGTAIMSKVMMTPRFDEKVIRRGAAETGEGLGLIDSFVVDQHFLERQRQNRLLSVLLQENRPGIGVDETSAVAIEDQRYLTAYGETVASVFIPTGKNTFELRLVPPGETIELRLQ